jgi:two-component system cell cycle sensor histidine kinase/response regulator CckA
MMFQKETKEQLMKKLLALQERNSELEAQAEDHRQEKESLLIKEKLLLKIFETIPDMFAVIDQNHRILFSNWCGGYEYVPEDIRSSHPLCHKAFHGIDTPCDPCHVTEVFRTGKPVLAEKDNPRIGFLEVRAYPVLDDSGRVIMVAENIRNITERKKAEAELHRYRERLEEMVSERTAELSRINRALRESEDRYALAVEGSNDGIWDWNLVTGEVYLSPRWKKMLGYGDDEIDNDSGAWKKLMHPDDYPRTKEILENYLAGRIPNYEFESRLRHKNGSWRWIFNRGICLRDEQGEPYRMAGSHSDVTERKLAEEELKRKELLLRTILETLPVGVAVFNREGDLVLENQARRKIWGHTSDSGSSFSDYKGWFTDSGKPVRTEDWPTYKACSKGIEEKKIIDIECFDGSKRTVVIAAAPMWIDENLFAGVSVTEDITEQRNLEHQLLQAQKIESVGLLAGGVAHEFNNLLTAIIGCCEELRETTDTYNEASLSNIKTIISAAKEAAELTRNLLTFSRKQALNLQPKSLADLINAAGKLLAQTLPENIQLSLELTEERLTILADGGQIKQVLVNLAINARDAMPDGGQLKIKARKATIGEEEAAKYGLVKGGDYAVTSISDTGTGMDEKIMEKIFEPFFTTKEVGKGTGLGLSIIYGIIRQHNGAVTVESKIGKGTTFTFFLPLLDIEVRRDEAREKVLPSGGGETILVAEDEELVRVFLEKALLRAGYRVITATDGEAAISAFKDHKDKIALVISDMVMPKKTGKDLYKAISELKPEIRIIFITGYSPDMVDLKGMPDGSVSFITKPFSKNDLLEKVMEFISGSRGQ